MAVTKIHRTSRIALYVAIAISLVVLALFFLGGQVPAEQKLVADQSQPRFTDILMYWMYILLLITVVVLIFFAIIGFFRNLKESPKKALSSLFVLLALGALLLVTYMMGDGTLLNIPGYEGADNNPRTLKMTDMWLYSMYAMLILTVLALIVSPFLKRRSK